MTKRRRVMPLCGGGAGGSGGGTTNHAALTNRSAADQHPIGAITGLQDALAGKSPSNHTHTAAEVGALPADTTALPNPNKLTFTGAVSAEYDGSSAVSVEIPQGGGGTTSVIETTKPVSVSESSVTLDADVNSQQVSLVWNVPESKTIPAFTNFFIAKSSTTYPRELSAGYNQLISVHGNTETFDASHKYFFACFLELDADSSVNYKGSSLISSSIKEGTVSESTWVYAYGSPTAIGQAHYYFNGLVGSGRINYAYAVDLTASMPDSVPSILNDAVDLLGGLSLIPGENYSGSTVGGIVNLTIQRGGEIISASSDTDDTITVMGGDVLQTDTGSVSFLLTISQTITITSKWVNKKWVAFGDSLTDGGINADTKYHKIIQNKTGITVVDMGVGGTGYWRGSDSGSAFYQRMQSCPSDADVITIFGSINDWQIYNNSVEIGTASDTLESGTLCGYINECINVAVNRAPFAQIALVTGLFYRGIQTNRQEALADAVLSVGKARRIKVLDLYRESGYRIDNDAFAKQFTADYSDTGTFGHPNNNFHERWLAPEFMELLNRMI